jgi:hypothetical protein
VESPANVGATRLRLVAFAAVLRGIALALERLMKRTKDDRKNKLELVRQTIAKLDLDQLDKVVGGNRRACGCRSVLGGGCTSPTD